MKINRKNLERFTNLRVIPPTVTVRLQKLKHLKQVWKLEYTGGVTVGKLEYTGGVTGGSEPANYYQAYWTYTLPLLGR